MDTPSAGEYDALLRDNEDRHLHPPTGVMLTPDLAPVPVRHALFNAPRRRRARATERLTHMRVSDDASQLVVLDDAVCQFLDMLPTLFHTTSSTRSRCCSAFHERSTRRAHGKHDSRIGTGQTHSAACAARYHRSCREMPDQRLSACATSPDSLLSLVLAAPSTRSGAQSTRSVASATRKQKPRRCAPEGSAKHGGVFATCLSACVGDASRCGLPSFRLGCQRSSTISVSSLRCHFRSPPLRMPVKRRPAAARPAAAPAAPPPAHPPRKLSGRYKPGARAGKPADRLGTAASRQLRKEVADARAAEEDARHALAEARASEAAARQELQTAKEALEKSQAAAGRLRVQLHQTEAQYRGECDRRRYFEDIVRKAKGGGF